MALEEWSTTLACLAPVCSMSRRNLRITRDSVASQKKPSGRRDQRGESRTKLPLGLPPKSPHADLSANSLGYDHISVDFLAPRLSKSTIVVLEIFEGAMPWVDEDQEGGYESYSSHATPWNPGWCSLYPFKDNSLQKTCCAITLHTGADGGTTRPRPIY